MHHREYQDAKQMTRGPSRYRLNRPQQNRSNNIEEIPPNFPVYMNNYYSRYPPQTYRGFAPRGFGGAPRGGRHHSFRGSPHFSKSTIQNIELVYKVRVPIGGKMYDTKWIIRKLQENVENFKPVLLSENVKGDFEFYLWNEDVANAVRALSRRFHYREINSKVEFYVTQVPAPWKKLSKVELDLINKVIAKRYDTEQRTLDLSNFANDEGFTSIEMVMMLTKGNVMLAVANRIDEKYGNITALSLANNSLKFLDHAASLVSIAKLVKILDLSNNMISSELELKKLSGLPVEQLFFGGNPILEKIATAQDYISLVQNTFPKCSILDGNNVEPLDIKHEIKTEDTFPFRTGLHGSEPIPGLVKQFIAEYYDLYDGEDGQETRKNLVRAYDETNSKFTLSYANLKGAGFRRYPNDESHATYLHVSRNLVYQKMFEKTRKDRIAKGSMSIAVALSKLPVTKHIRESFLVDVFVDTSNLVGFTLQGLFEDGKFSTEFDIPALNFFSRTFTVIPKEDGSIAVISDLLLISSASPQRLDRYKALMEQAAQNGPVPVSVSVMETANKINELDLGNELSEEAKEQMIVALSQFSGMNRLYSEKCLSDMEWVYETACYKFVELKGKIPAEAFIE